MFILQFKKIALRFFVVFTIIGFVFSTGASDFFTNHNASNSFSLNSKFSASIFSTWELAKNSLVELESFSSVAPKNLSVGELKDSPNPYTSVDTLELVEIFNDKFSLIFSRSSASVFQLYQQQTPTYWLVFEFNPPDLSLLTVSDHRFSSRSFTFVYAAHGNSNRLSGWKDGNSLYTSKITYS